ncbi:hypothetical protein MTBLM1_130019 [Rhodospirillaceae bacterium LM-1]|nr:hypothetical protein MTBLM1_130019 [Rhodospirillaceae bacterium LM-1]
MKPVSDARRQEIEAFSEAVRAAAARLAPQARDAERIRRLAEHLKAGPPAVKKWFYAQNCPRGGAASAISRLLEQITGPESDLTFDASEIGQDRH